MIMFFKVLKALLKFILEIWLRDRTFRQFVRGNLSLIVTTLGFIIMSFMFTRVYFIALAHESTITEVTHKYALLEKEVEATMPALQERLEWYRERYYEIKIPPEQTKQPPDDSKSTPTQTEKYMTPRPPPKDLSHRWERLSK